MFACRAVTCIGAAARLGRNHKALWGWSTQAKQHFVQLSRAHKTAYVRLACCTDANEHTPQAGVCAEQLSVDSSLAIREALADTQLQQAQQFIDLLIAQNATMNLTGADNAEAAFEMHVKDSLALLPLLDSMAHQHVQTTESERNTGTQFSIIDVGSGGGLPGVIIAIARPQWKVTLLDSLRKRCTFVERAVKQVGLQNTRVVWARAEEAGQSSDHREVYDVAMARAVARMRVLSELCLPLVKPGGYWLAAKGPDCQEEVAEAATAIAALQAKVMCISNVNAYGSAGQHTAVLVKKLGPTPSQYPRQPGKPNKRPL